MKLKHLIRIWAARCRGQEAVVLEDFQGDIYHRRARKKVGSEQLESWIFYHYKIGPLLLMDDGKVLNYDGSKCYIERWVYLDPMMRLEQILRGCQGFKF